MKQILSSNQNSKAGFTLIELLIVVAIIAILAAIAVPNFLEAQTRSKVSRTKADMRTVATALEIYFVDSNKYPEAYNGVNTTIEPRIQRYHRITSPIAYITSVPPDIFSRDVSSSFRDDEIRVFIYADRRSYSQFVTDPFGATENASNAYRLLWTEDFAVGEWVLRSRGPAGKAGGLGSTITFDSSYDSSNGTVSLGNIIYVGPGATFTN